MFPKHRLRMKSWCSLEVSCKYLVAFSRRNPFSEQKQYRLSVIGQGPSLIVSCVRTGRAHDVTSE